MSSNFSKKCLKRTDRQNIQLVEDSRSTNGSLENCFPSFSIYIYGNIYLREQLINVKNMNFSAPHGQKGWSGET